MKKTLLMVATLVLAVGFCRIATAGEAVFGIGAAPGKDYQEAAKTAAQQALAALKGAKPKMVLLNIMGGKVAEAEAAVAGTKTVFADTPIFGSTSSGAMANEVVVLQGVTMLVFAGALEVAGAGAPMDKKGDECGKAIARELLKNPLPKGGERYLFVTGDAHCPRTQYIAEGIMAELRLDIPAAGSAADGPLLCVVNGEVKAQHGIGILMAGDFSLGFGMDVSLDAQRKRDASLAGMLDAARRAGNNCVKQHPPQLLLVFDCVGRLNAYRQSPDGIETARKLLKSFAGDGQLYVFHGQGEYGRTSAEKKSFGAGFHIAMVSFGARQPTGTTEKH